MTIAELHRSVGELHSKLDLLVNKGRKGSSKNKMSIITIIVLIIMGITGSIIGDYLMEVLDIKQARHPGRIALVIAIAAVAIYILLVVL